MVAGEKTTKKLLLTKLKVTVQIPTATLTLARQA